MSCSFVSPAPWKLSRNVVFFPGDVQDARDEMMAGSFTEYAEYAYENIATLLADKFGDDTNVWIVRQVASSGASLPASKAFKGGVVLNQLVAEASHWRRLQSQNNPLTLSLGAMDRQIDKFFSSLHSIHWVDSGNGSFRGAYPTDEATLRALAQLRFQTPQPCSKTGAPLSPEISPEPIHIHTCS
ncbi:hypothetical protein PINS_up019774 [Pythium insidiosum]|nr:hypothetical protein PINS_up019774 [Pythium insidiosum]